MKPIFAMIRAPTGTCSCRLLARRHQREREIGDEQQHFETDNPEMPAEDLRKQQLNGGHRDHRGEPHHRAPGCRQPKPYASDQIDHGEEHSSDLIRRRIGIEARRERCIDAADHRPMVKAFGERQSRHHPQEHQQPM